MNDLYNNDYLIQSMFEKRYNEGISTICEKYKSLYSKNKDMDICLEDLKHKIQLCFNQRKKELKIFDLDSLNMPKWYLSPKIVGMELYVDLFAGNLKGFKNKIGYLKDLGINYIHILPLFKTRDGQDDGGYAISSYTEIKPSLGNMDEFEDLIDELRREKIYVCVDFILNHTAKENEWAEKARAGDEFYQNMYIMYDTDEIPQKYEETLCEAFPDIAPNNFTYYEDIKKWVFTMFYEYQWDLNYKNPFLLNRIIEKLMFIINRGINVVRLDAIRHIWKELGTDCSGLPQVHLIITILKTALYIVAPSVILKGEAITFSNDVLEYFGSDFNGCQTMYNVCFMGCLWNSLATANIEYMRMFIDRDTKIPEDCRWINYISCHDDVHFVLEEKYLNKLGYDFSSHKRLLIDFYKGDSSDSFSKGEFYAYDVRTDESRIAGTLASLCGIEKALEIKDKCKLDLGCRRILLNYGILLTFKGIPMIYSGDEIGLINNELYKNDSQKAIDCRWLNRQNMDWEKVKQLENMKGYEYNIFNNLKKMIQTKKDYNITVTKTFDTGNSGVLGLKSNSDKDSMIVLANFTSKKQNVNISRLTSTVRANRFYDILNGKNYYVEKLSEILLDSYEFLWLKD